MAYHSGREPRRPSTGGVQALVQAAKRKRLRTHPELAVARRCKLVVLGNGFPLAVGQGAGHPHAQVVFTGGCT